ncbi:MAG TPA: D-alanyl-D-alanine carboxypeptidase/D-alanyl-D-alanine-endopeptidase [Solirubrobacter sp.]|nr:D-alanyl-D-alanine carboxypeptidase/D-alanyl-D-alanine-endopeptidase [Solirubrobacter sp.]
MLLRRILVTAALFGLLTAPTATAATPAQTQRALAREMARAGTSSGAYVLDLGSGTQVYARKPDVARMPASVNKLYTTAGTLLRYGPGGELTTSVLAAGAPDASGTVTGDLVLRGGGDPTFGSTGAAALARQVKLAGVKRVTGRVVGDESAFDVLRGVPASGFKLSGDVGPLSALAFNHGRTGLRAPYFQASPARFAADAFAKALKRQGVQIKHTARAGLAAVTMTPLTELSSPPVSTIVRQMNQPSDNFIAETLIKGLGAQFGATGSTAAGAGVIRAALEPFGIAPTIADGSGLSRTNRTTPRQVVELLEHMDASDVASAFDASLPVAGRNGTLAYRLRGTAAQDRCHAKTGTLHDVSALAGYCTTTVGRRVAFAFLMNRINPGTARVLQDRMTAALARYASSSSRRAASSSTATPSRSAF